MRGFLFAAMLIVSDPALAERATGLLQCVGSDASNKPTQHMVVLYPKWATVDGMKYEFGKDAAEYALLGHDVLSDILNGPPLLMDINRVTGEYTMSVGVGDGSLRESGHCAKVHANL
jgi:hypothetical protein